MNKRSIGRSSVRMIGTERQQGTLIEDTILRKREKEWKGFNKNFNIPKMQKSHSGMIALIKIFRHIK